MRTAARYQKNSSTSKAGADHANRTISLRCRAVLAVIVAKGGATIAEIARELGVPNNEVSGRIANLRDDYKLIIDSGTKRATVTPCKGIVWKVRDARQAAQDVADTFKAHAPTVCTAPESDLTKDLPLFGAGAA